MQKANRTILQAFESARTEFNQRDRNSTANFVPLAESNPAVSAAASSTPPAASSENALRASSSFDQLMGHDAAHVVANSAPNSSAEAQVDSWLALSS